MTTLLSMACAGVTPESGQNRLNIQLETDRPLWDIGSGCRYGEECDEEDARWQPMEKERSAMHSIEMIGRRGVGRESHSNQEGELVRRQIAAS